MADTYLTVAQQVLELVRRPLSSKEIVQLSNEYDIASSTLTGDTPEKTITARIIEDIIKNRDASVFCRPCVGKYYLRRWLHQDRDFIRAPQIPSHRRTMPILGRILTCSCSSKISIASNPFEILASLGTFENIPPNDKLAIKIMVILKRDNQYFTFRPGKMSPYCNIKKLIPFIPTYVSEFDMDLFCADQIGITSAIERELNRIFSCHIGASIINDPQLFHITNNTIFFQINLDSGLNLPLTKRRMDICEPSWTQCIITKQSIQQFIEGLASD